MHRRSFGWVGHRISIKKTHTRNQDRDSERSRKLIMNSNQHFITVKAIQNSQKNVNSRRTLLLVATLAFGGAVILAFFSAPEKSEVIYSESLTVKANEYGTQLFGYYDGCYNVASFNVLNGTINSCEPLTDWFYYEWQAGHYMPNLTETDQGTFQYGSRGPMMSYAAAFRRYFFFFNQDSYDKVIQLRVTSYWQETNTTNLTIGAALMTAGLGIALGLALMHSLKTNPRFTISHRTQAKDVQVH